MSHLSSLPEDAVLLDVFRAFPATARPLIAYHEALMRGPSPLSVAERELLAAYVSGLNACAYCHGVHGAVATRFGVAEGVLERLLAGDLRAAAPKLRPLLAYAEKLTVAPLRAEAADADAVFAAGWNEQALHDTVSVVALFHFMNRLVEGLGIAAGDDYFAHAAERLGAGGYAGLADLLGEAGEAKPPQPGDPMSRRLRR